MEEYFIAGLRGIVLGVARGLKGFGEHKKKDPKEGFNAIKYLKSVAICIVIGVGVEFIKPYLPIDDNMILDFLTDYATPWVGTSAIEAIWK